MKILNIAIRSIAIIAAGILLWSIGHQARDTSTMDTTPTVVTSASTHVCGDQVCGN